MDLKKYFDAAQAASKAVTDKADEINVLFEQGKTTEALAMSPELQDLKAKAKDANQLYLAMQAASEPLDGQDPAKRFVQAGKDREPAEVKDLRKSPIYIESFFKALKNGVSPKTIGNGMHAAEPFKVLMDALSETGGSPAGAEGGFLLPIDFDNLINQQRRQAVDLSPYVNVEEVTAYSGWRAYEVAAAALPFAEITESDFPSGERIPAMESPTFTKVEYAVKKYGGYLPVASDLFSDTPAAIMAYLAKWCGRKVSLTNTSHILAIMNALTPVNVTDYKTVFMAIKTALNKTLDPAISATAKIFVNQTGFDLLDGLLDGTGRPLLQPDPTNETVKRYKGREVVAVSDAQQPNLSTETITPILVGDGNDLMTLFKRMAGEMSTTNIGGTAWRNDNTEIKYIMRQVAKQVDSAAMKLLKVTLPA